MARGKEGCALRWYACACAWMMFVRACARARGWLQVGVASCPNLPTDARRRPHRVVHRSRGT
eukprot:6185984-Pleurochrysis_carterae.AAC.4